MLLAINIQLSNKNLLLDSKFREKLFNRCEELAEDFTGYEGRPIFGKENNGNPTDNEIETVESLLDILNGEFPEITYDVYIITFDGKGLEKCIYVNGELKLSTDPFILPKNIKITYTIENFHVECNLSSAFCKDYEGEFDLWSDGVLSKELHEKRNSANRNSVLTQGSKLPENIKFSSFQGFPQQVFYQKETPDFMNS